MSGKSIGTVKIGVGINTKALDRSLRDASWKLKKASRKWGAIGRSMTTSFTLPFAAIAGSSVKLSSDLETNFSKIKNLVGVGEEQLINFKTGVSSLSTEVGRSQAELSDALFDITSAGFKGAKGLNVLTEASKLSVIGMGDVRSIASSLTGTLFSFQKQNVSAEKAAAVFFKTAQLGKFRVEELSSAMSGLNVMAANLGVTIEETGALTAQYSKTGKNASESATGFEAALNSFLTATPKLRRELKDMGTNIDDVRASIRERGFLSTMEELQGMADKTGKSIADLFGRKEGKLFVLSLLDDIEASKTAVSSMYDVIGEKEAAFADSAKTSAHIFKIALVNIQNAGIKLGTILLPIASDLATTFSDFVTRISSMNPKFIKLGLAIGGLGAVIGPVALGLSSILSVGSLLIPILGSLGTALGGIITAFVTLNPIALGIVAVLGIGTLLYDNWLPFKNLIDDLAGSFGVLGEEISFVGKVLNLINSAVNPAGAAVNRAVGKAIRNRKSTGGATGSWGDPEDKSFADQIKGNAEFLKTFLENIKGIISGEDPKSPPKPQPLLKDINIKFPSKYITQKLIKDKATGEEKLMDVFIPGKALKKDKDHAAASLADRMSDDITVMSSGYDKLNEKQKEQIKIWQVGLTAVASISKDIAGIFDRIYQNRIDSINRTYDLEKKKILASGMLRRNETDALLALEEKKDQEIRKYKRKQARAEKLSGIFSATINMLVGISQALAKDGPLGIITGIAVGVAGAANIATLAATPLPALAGGGIAYGDTLARIGEYAGSRINPEVISPLSNLTAMIRESLSDMFHQGPALRSGLSASRVTLDISLRSQVSGADLLLIHDRARQKYARI